MVKPMLLQEEIVDKPLLEKEKKNELINYIKNKYQNHIFQIKQNGVRAVISVKNKKITSIRDKRDNPILQHYPELKDIEIPVEEGLLDAEIVMFNEHKKTHFYNEYDEDKNITQPGIQLRSASVKGKDIVEKYPVNIVFFDVLKLNGKLMISEPYEKRIQELRNALVVNNSDRWEVVEDWVDFERIWNKIVEEDLEGVVIKNPKGLYEIDTRSKNNIKLKNYKFMEVEITNTEQNNKGCRATGISDDGLEVNFQVFGVDKINKGTKMKMKYLEKIGGHNGRYTQTTIA